MLVFAGFPLSAFFCPCLGGKSIAAVQINIHGAEVDGNNPLWVNKGDDMKPSCMKLFLRFTGLVGSLAGFATVKR